MISIASRNISEGSTLRDLQTRGIETELHQAQPIVVVVPEVSVEEGIEYSDFICCSSLSLLGGLVAAMRAVREGTFSNSRRGGLPTTW